MPGKYPFLFLSPLCLSLSLSDSSISPLFAFPSLFFFFSFLFFLPYPPTLPSLVCSIVISFHFFPFSLFSFSLIFHFLFYPPSSFSYPYESIGGTFPLLFSLATCHHHVFLPYFLYFFFLLLHHVTHSSM